MPADRNLAHLFPVFRDKVKTILSELAAYAATHTPGVKWIVSEGYRTAKYQNSLYQKGRTKKGAIVTFKDGYTHESNHQNSCAVDIVPVDVATNKILWSTEHWPYLGHLARKHGLIWGGDWPKLRDMPHCEAPAKYHKAARQWQREHGLR